MPQPEAAHYPICFDMCRRCQLPSPTSAPAHTALLLELLQRAGPPVTTVNVDVVPAGAELPPRPGLLRARHPMSVLRSIRMVRDDADAVRACKMVLEPYISA